MRIAYSAVGTTVQDICGTVGDVTQEIGAIMGNSPSAQLSGALVNYAGNYLGNEIRTFGVEAGNCVKDIGEYAENDIKRTTFIYGAAAKTIVRDENVKGTFSRGVDICVSLGSFMADVSIVLSTDLKGNMTIQDSLAWGATAAAKPGFSASLSIVKTITNAPDVNALLDEGGAVGGSLAGPIGWVPLCAGADFVIVGDLNSKPNENYYGYSASVGVGMPGVEGHAKMSETATVKRIINIFDFLFGLDSKE